MKYVQDDKQIGIMQDEVQKIAARYERRKAIVGDRYARFNPEVIARTQERQRALVSLLKAQEIPGLAGVDILEIGCGISARRVILAPPISRRVVRLHPKMYGVLNALPLLRTHTLCFIQ
jgi:hypothetical protein